LAFLRLSRLRWRPLRLAARLGVGLVLTFAAVATAAFGFDLRLVITSPGTALIVKDGEAEFGVICADGNGSVQLRTYRIPSDLGIKLAVKANRFRERPIPIIRLSPEVPAPPRPKLPVLGSGRGDV